MIMCLLVNHAFYGGHCRLLSCRRNTPPHLMVCIAMRDEGE